MPDQPRDETADETADEVRPARPTPLRVAVAVVGVQALALVVLAAWVLVDGLAGGTPHVARGLLGGAFALLGAAVLVVGARGLARLSQAARTPVVVLELLALPVSYTIAFQADLPALGGPILVSALAVLYCLFTPPVREIFDRQMRF